jgi:hypothetical protein
MNLAHLIVAVVLAFHKKLVYTGLKDSNFKNRSFTVTCKYLDVVVILGW